MTERDRLYGLPGDELLCFDPAEVVQEWLDNSVEGDEPRFTIEEFSVYPSRYHLPHEDRLLEWIDETVAENGEVGEDFELPLDDEIKAAADAFLDLIASKITWRMADEKLRELQVTPSDDPENPLLDGAPTWQAR